MFGLFPFGLLMELRPEVRLTRSVLVTNELPGRPHFNMLMHQSSSILTEESCMMK